MVYKKYTYITENYFLVVWKVLHEHKNISIVNVKINAQLGFSGMVTIFLNFFFFQE